MSERGFGELPNPRLPWNVYGYTAVAAFSSFVYGYNTGLIAPAIIFIPETIPLSVFETGAIVSIILLGAIIGSFVSGYFADIFGRRRVLAYNNIIMIGAAITASLGDNSSWLMISRFILGIGVGIASVVPSLFITEMAPTHVRGKLGAYNQLNGWAGIIASYFVGYEIVACSAGDKCWRFMFASGAVFSIFHLILSYTVLPDTPRWLISCGRRDDALSVLTRIYGDEHEAHIIQQYQILCERKHHREPVCLNVGDLKNNVRILMICVILQVLQQFSGTSAILYYTTYVLHLLGFNGSDSLFYNAIACIPQLVVLILVVFLLDRNGRRPALLISEFGITVGLVMIGIASYTSSIYWQFWFLIFGVIIHRAAFSAGMGPVPTVLVSEILPFAIRGRGLAVCQGINWGLNFIITIAFPTIFVKYPPYLIYWAFAGCSLVGLAFISCLVPETKNVSLEKLEESLSDHSTSPLISSPLSTDQKD